MLGGIMKRQGSSVLLLLVMLVLPVTVSSISVLYLSRYESVIAGFTVSQWILFYIATSFTMSFALTPTTFVALVTGYFIGWQGLYGLVPSYMLASLAGFFLASVVDKGSFFEQIEKKERIKKLMTNLKNDEFWVIFFCRISPALPFAMMNVLLSFLKVNLKNYLGGSILGMLPRTILSVWIGTQASDIMKMLKGKEEPDAGNLLVIGLLVFSVGGLYVLFTRAIKKYEKV